MDTLADRARRVGEAVGHEQSWKAPDGTVFNHAYLVEQAGGCVGCRAEAAALTELRALREEAARWFEQPAAQGVRGRYEGLEIARLLRALGEPAPEREEK